MNLLVCENLSMSYENNNVLHDLSFAVEQGDYLSIIGENGSGKTTLMKGILGLMSPSAGTIMLSGISRREVGYLPQQTVVQKDFPASVIEVVLSGTVGKSKRLFYNSYDKKKARDNLKKLGIEQLQNKSYKELSGGQQQRVLLARALCAASKLLVLDEPTSGLDPVATAELYEILTNLNKTEKMTIITVSHDIESAVANSNKILHLGKETVFYGRTEEYIKTDIYTQMTGGDKK
ncbi:MAG: metal ABC transporter ATP-binding protein [Clostridia bacterium]|nr:metal ABC transporter ATP-binding protein [Clostridia bacterium]